MTSGDGTTLSPPNFVKKTAKLMNTIFRKCCQNSLIQLLKPFLKNLSALEACNMIIFGGMANIEFTILEIFRVYLGYLYIFLREIFLGSKIFSSSCCRFQNFDHKFPSYPGNKAQSPDYGHLLSFLTFFELPTQAQAFNLGDFSFYEKLFKCMYFHV